MVPKIGQIRPAQVIIIYKYTFSIISAEQSSVDLCNSKILMVKIIKSYFCAEQCFCITFCNNICTKIIINMYVTICTNI
jgi:hypothetical protein